MSPASQGVTEIRSQARGLKRSSFRLSTHQQPMGGAEGRGGAAGTLDIRDLIRDAISGVRRLPDRALWLSSSTRVGAAPPEDSSQRQSSRTTVHPQPAPRRRLWYLCETTIESVPARLCGSIPRQQRSITEAHRENRQRTDDSARRLAAQNRIRCIYRSDNSCRSFVRASLAQRHLHPRSATCR